jgi:transaldolase
MNQEFWNDKNLPLTQEIIFASTGQRRRPIRPTSTSRPRRLGHPNQPPATNEYIEKSGKTYTRTVDQLPPKAVLDEIERRWIRSSWRRF